MVALVFHQYSYCIRQAAVKLSLSKRLFDMKRSIEARNTYLPLWLLVLFGMLIKCKLII